MKLYKGFPTIVQVDIPTLVAINHSLHFSPYEEVARWYGQTGIIACYECPIQVPMRKHDGPTGIPFEHNPDDYEAELTPDQIAQLTLLWQEPGKLLPGSFLVGP